MKPNSALPASPERVAMVRIYFGHSQSLAYREATDLCRGMPSFESTGTGKDTVHSIALPITEIAVLMRLSELVGGWKSFRITIDGREARRDDLIRLGGECYGKRQASPDPAQYCFGNNRLEYNLWGCRRLDMPIDEAGHGWMAYGRLDEEGLWHFDKARIGQALDAAMTGCRLCPVFDRARVLKTLLRLPETVDPRQDERWRYRIGPHHDGAGGYGKVGIAPVAPRMADYVVGGYRPRWDYSRDLRDSRTEIYLGPVDRWSPSEPEDGANKTVIEKEPVSNRRPAAKPVPRPPARSRSRLPARWPQVVALALVVLGLAVFLL